MTPLHVAAEKGDRLDIVKYLIGKGADINIKDYSGVRYGPSHCSCICDMMDRYFMKITVQSYKYAFIVWQTCRPRNLQLKSIVRCGCGQ